MCVCVCVCVCVWCVHHLWLFLALVNRRMDEWVCLPRIDMGRGPVDEGQKELESILELDGRERKVTRNLKRKHDEINHVQKVGGGILLVCITISIHTPLAIAVGRTSPFVQCPSPISPFLQYPSPMSPFLQCPSPMSPFTASQSHVTLFTVSQPHVTLFTVSQSHVTFYSVPVPCHPFYSVPVPCHPS